MAKQPSKKFVKSQSKVVTQAEALAMANALADALGFPKQDQGEKPTKIAPE